MSMHERLLRYRHAMAFDMRCPINVQDIVMWGIVARLRLFDSYSERGCKECASNGHYNNLCPICSKLSKINTPRTKGVARIFSRVGQKGIFWIFQGGSETKFLTIYMVKKRKLPSQGG